VAIIESGVQSRKAVVWWEQKPPDGAVFALEQRQYTAARCSDENLSANDFIAGVSTVVFVADRKLSRLQQAFNTHLLRILNSDCHVVVFAHRGSIETVKNSLSELGIEAFNIDLFDSSTVSVNSLPPQPYVRVWPSGVEMDWSDFANLIVQNVCDNAPNFAASVEIDDNTPLTEADEILIRRAFYDCSRVQLKKCSGGKSGAAVFKAFSELKNQSKQWPQANFVKLDSRLTIQAEYDKYVQKVASYIPFQLGPHLFRERCCLGADRGIIVGNFVEGAENLNVCASGGRASAAISGLFDRTLVGWHRQAARIPGTVAEILSSSFPKQIPERRLEIAKGFGSKLDLAFLKTLLSRCCGSPVLLGPIHGDLHCGNVMVRGTDSILIDFSSHEENKLILLDPAALEASLLIDGFGSYDGTIEELLKSIKVLYESDLFDKASVQANPNDPFYWYHNCVHQVRLHARQWETSANQYAAVLAFMLLKKASKDPDVGGHEDQRRACAYHLAEVVLSKTFGP
jgi:hypothetical protein